MTHTTQGHKELVVYLAERVDDKNARNGEGQTPLMLAMTGALPTTTCQQHTTLPI